MKMNFALVAVAVVTLSTQTAVAGTVHHHRHAGVVAPLAYQGSNENGDVVARAAARAQHEPGVTNEFSPDARQTATGGPVGGVPGFEGGL